MVIPNLLVPTGIRSAPYFSAQGFCKAFVILLDSIFNKYKYTTENNVCNFYFSLYTLYTLYDLYTLYLSFKINPIYI